MLRGLRVLMDRQQMRMKKGRWREETIEKAAHSFYVHSTLRNVADCDAVCNCDSPMITQSQAWQVYNATSRRCTVAQCSCQQVVTRR